jgi:hypothetical protein
MKLKLKNIGKITSAEVEIAGITVIAGPNSTGKSTISKSLFAMFNSLHNLSQKVKKEQEISIRQLFSNNIDEFFKEFILIKNKKISPEDLSALLVGVSEKKDIINIMKKFEISSDFYSDILNGIEEINSIPKKRIEYEILQSSFQKEFNGRIHNIFSDNNCEIGLVVQGREQKIVFNHNDDLIEDDNLFQLDHEVVYIDDPFVMDYNSKSEKEDWVFYSDGITTTKNHREAVIAQYSKTDTLTIVQRASIKSNLDLAYAKINEALESELKLIAPRNSDDQKLPFDKLPVESLSSGAKTFYLMKVLLDNGTIVKNGTLILDEPEVHLHPAWEIILAEMIVLLQKEMQLHILINTHSPYFIRAIDVYSRKHEIDEKTNYYLSFKEGSGSTVKRVEYLTEIYKLLSKPLQILEDEGI